jgi:hypothetical protein
MTSLVKVTTENYYFGPVIIKYNNYSYPMALDLMIHGKPMEGVKMNLSLEYLTIGKIIVGTQR